MSKIIQSWKHVITDPIHFDNPDKAIKSGEFGFMTQRYIWCADKLNYTDQDVLSVLVDFADISLRSFRGYDKTKLTEDVLIFINDFLETGNSNKIYNIINKIKKK